MSRAEHREWALKALRAADAILVRAGRDRPHGYKSSLSDRQWGVEPTVERIEWANRTIKVLQSIEHLGTRRVLAFAMATDHGEPLLTMGEVARLVGISDATMGRWKAAGLDIVARELGFDQQRRIALDRMSDHRHKSI